MLRAPRRSMLALVLLVTLGTTACRRLPYDEVTVSFDERTPTSYAVAEPGGIRLGIGAMISPRRVNSAYAALASKLGAALKRSVGLFYARSHRQLDDLLRTGRIDVAFVDTGAYLELAREQPGLPVLAVPRVAGKLRSAALIVVRADHPAHSFNGLRGSRFVFGDPLSLAGERYPAALLRHAGLERASFFGAISIVSGYDRALRAVSSGVQDATAVSSLALAYLHRHPSGAHRSTKAGLAAAGKRGLRVIARLEGLANPPIVARPDASPAQLERWRAALLALHTRPAAMRALERLGVERFVRPPPKLFESATELWRRGR